MSRLLEFFTSLFSYGLAIDEQIAYGPSQGSVDEVYVRARALIEQARSSALAAGKPAAAVESAAFAVVAWFDEIITRNPSWWSQASPLQVSLFNTNNAGNEFFEHLSNLKGGDEEVREVYYHALLLGFVGQYYFETDDHGELGKIKELNSRQLPVAPVPLQTLREEQITPQPYQMKDPPGPDYPKWWDALLTKVGAVRLAVLAVLWRFIKGARKYPRASRARQRIGDLGPGNPGDEREPLAKMSAAIQKAKRTIQRSPELVDIRGRGGRNSLYRVPWMLFLGEAEADVHGLLRAASTSSPFPAPAGADGEAIWRWWFFKSLIAIETSPRIVCDASARTERGLWYQALMQLASERDQLPLNGIVACIGARSLLGNADALKNAGMRLRRLIDEAMEHLQVQLPVYVMVTGLQTLPGYAAFRAALPVEVFAQAMGWRLPENETVSADTSAKFDGLFAPVAERLHALRLTALAAQHEVKGRRGVFEFVQSISRLQGGLRRFIGLLLEDNPFQRTPRWRGLYFAGGPGANTPAGAFVADLFTRFLPADQPLATPSFKNSMGRTGATSP